MALNVKPKRSPHTPDKQELLPKIIDYWFHLAMGERNNRRVLLCDCNAGCGYYDDGEEGSAIIMIKQAIAKAPYFERIDLLFYEFEPTTYKTLCESIDHFKAHNHIPHNVRIQKPVRDFNEMIPVHLGALKKSIKWDFALVYHDPNGALNFDLTSLNVQGIDILLHFDFNRSGKAQISRHGKVEFLGDDMAGYFNRLRKHAYVVDTAYKGMQWAFWLGMNYDYGEFKKIGLHKTTSKIGKIIWCRLTRPVSECDCLDNDNSKLPGF